MPTRLLNNMSRKHSELAIKSVLKHFDTGGFLDLFANHAEAIVTCEEVLNILKKGGFY